MVTIYDFLAVPTDPIWHIVGPNSLSTTLNAFTLTNDGGFTNAQKTITYSLQTASGGSIAGTSWVSFDPATRVIDISSNNPEDGGEHNFLLKGQLSDPYNSQA